MKIFWIVLAVVLALLISFVVELYKFMFCRCNSKLFTFLFDKKGHEDNYYIVRDKANDDFRIQQCERINLKSDRGENLKGFYYDNGAHGKKIVFIIHGYRQDHIEIGGFFYRFYKERNIDIFCCDHTASGESEGQFVGFDVFEHKDCLKWLDYIVNRFGEDTEIILHGFSMGAATVMQMSSYCPKNVKFIIEDSGFECAKASLSHQVGPLYNPIRGLNKLIAHYDINDSDVTESLKKSRIPMLFVHGKDDKLVPSVNGPKLYDMYEGEKDGLFMPKTRHIETMYTSPKEYGEKIDSFIAKYLSK